jgi:hypothetical protein
MALRNAQGQRGKYFTLELSSTRNPVEDLGAVVSKYRSAKIGVQWVDTHGRQHLLRLPSVWGRKLACPTGPLIISMVVRTDSQHSMVREQ